MEYRYKKIAELGKIITGKTPPTENEAFFGGDYPFITPSDICSYDEKYLVDTERYISSLGSRKLKGMLLPKGSICFVCIGSTIGKMCMTNKESYTNQQINSIIPNREYDNDYLFYYLRHIKGYFQSIGAGTGSGKGIINKTLFSKTKIRVLEDKDSQKKIASILSAYDKLIENNNKRIKILEQMAENLYKEWFVRFRFPGHETTQFENGIPKGWSINRFDTAASLINGRAYLMPELLSEGKYRIVRVGNFSGKDEWFYSDMELESDKYCEQGDLLYKWACNFGPEIWNEEKVIYHYHIWKVIPKNNVNKAYLYFYLKASTPLWMGGTNGTAMVHITKESMEKKKMLVPPKSILDQFDNIVGPMIRNRLSLLKHNENLIKQRDLLLPRLMSGKLAV